MPVGNVAGQASAVSEKLQRYASVLLMSASSDGELIPAVKAADAKYTSRTEGQPGTLAFRTFVQVCHCCLVPMSICIFLIFKDDAAAL